MTDSLPDIIKAARQVVDTELAMGGDFLPAKRNPLPRPAAAPTAQTADVGCAGSHRASGGEVLHTQDAAKQPAPQGKPIGATMTIQQKQAALEELRTQCVSQCQQCILAGTRTNIVFGEGSAGASLMFVGEAPGADEDAAGKPFVGRAGELLGKMIVAMGITRDDVYIANMLKCRPPENRSPAHDEIVACFPFLVRQIQIIAPKVIVTLGNPATHGLLNIDTGITKIRGQWQALPNIGEGLEGIPVMPTFHPAYVLRNYNDQTRGMVWDDLKKVMQLLGMKPPAKKG